MRFDIRVALIGATVLLWWYSMFAGCTSTVDHQSLQPTLSSIQTNIFDKSCTTSSCHSAFSMRGGLVLTPDSAYANLVGVHPENSAANFNGLLRVFPGKPDSSFLLIKLTGPRLGEGLRMPNDGGTLSAEQIEAIRQWIADGAKR